MEESKDQKADRLAADIERAHHMMKDIAEGRKPKEMVEVIERVRVFMEQELERVGNDRIAIGALASGFAKAMTHVSTVGAIQLAEAEALLDPRGVPTEKNAIQIYMANRAEIHTYRMVWFHMQHCFDSIANAFHRPLSKDGDESSTPGG